MSFKERMDENARRAREKSDRIQLTRHAKKIDGKPWWESSMTQFVCEYKDLDQLNMELAIANPLGWYIDDTTGDSGHINVGRTATGAVLTGGISLLFGGSRSKGKTTVTWRRD